MEKPQPKKLLVSACLLGQPVRYDGKSKPLQSEQVQQWLAELKQQQGLFVLCPEVAGGLPTPRPAAEYQAETNLVITQQQTNVTKEFQAGAQIALQLCQQHDIKFALLKANSPSCGNKHIYDGRFSGNLVDGMGLTAKLLTDNGVTVFSELELEQLQALMATSD